jgi:hypothetical protein
MCSAVNSTAPIHNMTAEFLALTTASNKFKRRGTFGGPREWTTYSELTNSLISLYPLDELLIYRVTFPFSAVKVITNALDDVASLFIYRLLLTLLPFSYPSHFPTLIMSACS